MGLVMFVATVTVGDTVLPETTVAQVETPTKQETKTVESEISETTTENHVPSKEGITTEDKVKEYFSDLPIMAEVASCESNFRQFGKNGDVLRGIENNQDVGVMQINEKYHLETAQKLGLNIYTLEGNMAYGRYLYEREGTRPWNYSSKCWGKSREVALK